MAKPEWGVKRICPNCGTRYYDMRKDPPTCPSCGTVFDPEALLRSRRARPIPVEEAPPKKVAPEAEDEDTPDREVEEDVEVAAEGGEDAGVPDIEDEEVADDVAEDEDDVLLEDADELGDEDDMGEVVEVENDEDR